MTIEAVVFDIGNVLIEWVPENFYDRELGVERRKEMFAKVDLHAMNDRVDLGENFRDVIYETAEIYPDFRDEIRMWHDRWLELAHPVIPHSVKLLRALRAKGIPVFALTNFGVESFELAQSHFDFLNEFDRPYVSGRLRMAKPDPAIYAHVEADSGVSPENLLFADDRQDNFDMAKSRGWNVHLFQNPQGWADALVDHKVLSREEAAA